MERVKILEAARRNPSV